MTKLGGLAFAASLALAAVTLVAPIAVSPPVHAAVCAESADSEVVAGEESPEAGCCVGNTKYTVTSSSSVRVPFSDVPTFRNGPGGTLAVSREYSGSATFSITVGASIDVGPVLAQAKLSVDATLTKSNSTTSTNTYTRKITSGKFGNVKYVSYGKKVTFRKYRVNADCSTTTLTSKGVITYPSSTEGWYYWETSG